MGGLGDRNCARGFDRGRHHARPAPLSVLAGRLVSGPCGWRPGTTAAVAALLLPMVHIETVADAIGFLFIALLVMFIANILGSVMSQRGAQDGPWLSRPDCRRSLRIFAGSADGHAHHTGGCGLLSAGTLARGSKAAQVFLRSLSPEREGQSGGTCRARSQWIADDWNNMLRNGCTPERGKFDINNCIPKRR